MRINSDNVGNCNVVKSNVSSKTAVFYNNDRWDDFCLARTKNNRIDRIMQDRQDKKDKKRAVQSLSPLWHGIPIPCLGAVFFEN
jgi:hypothetical protein